MKSIAQLFWSATFICMCTISAIAQTQVPRVTRTIVDRCYKSDVNQYVITTNTNDNYVALENRRHGWSSTIDDFNIYIVDSNLHVLQHHILNDSLLQYTDYSINFSLLGKGQLVFTGRGYKGSSLLRFTGTFNLATAAVNITNEYHYGQDSFPFDANPFIVSDSLIAVIDYLSSGFTNLHLVNSEGQVESKAYAPGYGKATLDFYSQINTDSLIYLKNRNFNIDVFNINTLEFEDPLDKQYLSSLPHGVAVNHDSLYYSFGAWLGVDDDGYYDQGWTPSRAYDLFLYTFDKESNLVKKTEFTDRTWYQQQFTEFFQTQNFFLQDSLLKVIYTSFPDETATGSKDHMTGEKFEDSKLSFATVDLQGNLIDKKDYFENDGKNHFNWYMLENEGGYLLVNTVLDVNQFPDTTTNLELMQLDKNGLLVGIKTIKNSSRKPLKIYPNPAQSQGKVNLSWSGMEKQSWQVKLYDKQGRLVHATEILQGVSETNLQLPELPKGNYIIRAEGSGKQVHTGTLVVE